MASTHKHIRSSTANKRPTTAIADGQIALNTNSTSPGLFFKDSTGATIIKIGPVHVGTTAPNVSPAAGGSSGNSTGEVWLDTSLTPVGVKIWNGSTWVNATPIGSTTVQGLLELATSAETQAGTDTDRAVTPAGLQSKVSDSTSTTSSTTIASSTAVKAAYDLANAALPKSGGTVTGNLEIGTTGSLTFEGATADAFETTLAVADPTADRIITLPDTTGTVITTGDTGTVTGTMIASGTVTSTNIADGTIVDADISATAEIAVSKLANGAARQLLQTDAAGTGVEWASNIDIPGTLDVTSAATFDSTIGASAGAAATPSITFTGDLNTGIWSPGADTIAASTAGSERVRIDSSGRVGVGTTSPTQALHVVSATTNNVFIETTSSSTRALFSATSKDSGGNNISALFGPYGDGPFVAIGSTTNHAFRFITNNAERARIDSSGRVGIGTTSPTTKLDVVDTAADPVLSIRAGSTFSPIISFEASGANAGAIKYDRATQALTFLNNSSSNERARIDSSGRLLVGTSTARSIIGVTSGLEVEGTTFSSSSISLTNNSNDNLPPFLSFGKSRAGSNGGNTAVQINDYLGQIQFGGADGTDLDTPAANIACQVDGTPGSNDMPGRLVFSTTADGTSSPTEAMRINSYREILIGRTTRTGYLAEAGVIITGEGAIASTRDGGTALTVGRLTNDGTLVELGQGGTVEGTISVSGTTVSYNGAHLSRWSQIPGINPYDKTVRPEILRGTVMSNLDEMCDWVCPTSGDSQDNEQLNKTKISDVEGDKNVAGVFQAWDDDDDTWVNDYYLAMTGDFVIRIAAGITVERGDLLISAGDGTAKPQDDDLIRSKTIAKVTSTNVSCTYDDGSYCVPCVLMAC